MARQKLSEVILEDLKKRILTGEYRTNQKLPTERELANYYDTSRIPVREALRQLADAGIVRTSAGSGTVVISSGSTLSDTSYGTPFMENVTLLKETIILRRLIESQAAREAAQNRSADDIKELQNALFDSINQIRKLKAKENNSFFEADAWFHKAIAKASHNQLLVDCLDAIPYIKANHQFLSLKYTTPRDEVVSYHTQIYENILDMNGERAYESMYNHLYRVETLMMNHKQEVGGLGGEDGI